MFKCSQIIQLIKIQLLLSKEMQMFHQFSMIRDFDALPEFGCIQDPKLEFVFHKDDLNKETQDNELGPCSSYILTRSIKAKPNHKEVSFEQNFMKQHLKSFKNMLQKYMELTLQQPSSDFKLKSGLNLTNSYYYIKNEQPCGSQYINLKELFKVQKGRMTQQQKEQFLLDLTFEEKLNEFLCFVCEQVSFQKSVDFLYIANIIWQNYIPKQQFGLKQKQIDEIIQTLLCEKFTVENLRSLNIFNLQSKKSIPKISSQQLYKQLRILIKCFGTTILLILEEYFNNPYSKVDEQRDSLKRDYLFKDISNDQSNDEFSDDEDGGYLSFGNKKRKQ